MSKVKLPRGLRNFGNTCYLNVVLQSLASIRSFHLFLAEQPNTKDRLVTYALSKAIRDLSLSSRDGNVIEPDLARVRVISNRFPRYEQQDAHEFMQYVMNVLSDETDQAPPISIADAFLSVPEQARRSLQIGSGRIFRRLVAGYPQRSLGSSSGMTTPVGSVTSNSSVPGTPDSSTMSAHHYICAPIPKSASHSALLSSHAMAPSGISASGSMSPMPSSPSSTPPPAFFENGASSFAGLPTDRPISPMSVAEETTKVVPAAPQRRRRNPFVGLLHSALVCQTCRKQSEPSYQKFLDLSLAIPLGMSPPTLDDCLRTLSDPESLSEVECMHCSRRLRESTGNNNPKLVERHSATKKMSIARAPVGLCLHLRRLVHTVSGMQRKVDVHVSFPLELDLAPYCATPFSVAPVKPAPAAVPAELLAAEFIRLNSKPPAPVAPSRSSRQHTQQRPSVPMEYDLVAVVVHHGSGAGGHYAVFRKLLWDALPHTEQEFNDRLQEEPKNSSLAKGPQAGRWVYISDETVREVSVEDVKKCSAYMLYYERRSAQP